MGELLKIYIFAEEYQSVILCVILRLMCELLQVAT